MGKAPGSIFSLPQTQRPGLPVPVHSAACSRTVPRALARSSVPAHRVKCSCGALECSYPLYTRGGVLKAPRQGSDDGKVRADVAPGPAVRREPLNPHSSLPSGRNPIIPRPAGELWPFSWSGSHPKGVGGVARGARGTLTATPLRHQHPSVGITPNTLPWEQITPRGEQDKAYIFFLSCNHSLLILTFP